MRRLRTLLAAGFAGAMLVATAPVATAAVTFTLPEPTGRSGVGMTLVHLVDHGRADPWKPDRKRELMVSVWYPAKNAERYPRAPWVSPGVAPWIDAFASFPPISIPMGSVDWSGSLTAGHLNAPVDKRFGGRPVVIFSPGLGSPSGPGSVLIAELASRGYVVIGIDHTFETAVEFPDGRVEMPEPIETTPEYLKKALDVRVGDTRFLLDELPRINKTVLRGAMDTSRVGIFGYSYGGFTSGEAMYHDRRIKAGVNLNGAMEYGTGLHGEVSKHGLDRPFLFLGSQLETESGEVYDHNHVTDPSWAEFWANQRGWKGDITLKNSRHLSYCDLQVVLPQLAKPLNIPPSQWEPGLGTIDPRKSIRHQTESLTAFYDRFLR